MNNKWKKLSEQYRKMFQLINGNSHKTTVIQFDECALIHPLSIQEGKKCKVCTESSVFIH